jgi:hypothetical protein
MWRFHQRADRSPDEGDEPGKGETSEEGEKESSKHGLSADQIELIERLVVLALGAIEPAQKLVEVLMHMR